MIHRSFDRSWNVNVKRGGQISRRIAKNHNRVNLIDPSCRIFFYLCRLCYFIFLETCYINQIFSCKSMVSSFYLATQQQVCFIWHSVVTFFLLWQVTKAKLLGNIFRFCVYKLNWSTEIFISFILHLILTDSALAGCLSHFFFQTKERELFLRSDLIALTP